MKLLFLDIYGVLKTSYDNPHLFDKSAVTSLNRILDKTGAYIVITDPVRIQTSVNQLNVLLKTNGILAPVIGKTEMLNDIKSKDKKGLEILNWIMDNQPDCSSLCIIDDITKNIVNIFPEWVVKIEKAKIKSKIIESINTFDIPIHVPTIFDTIYC